MYSLAKRISLAHSQDRICTGEIKLPIVSIELIIRRRQGMECPFQPRKHSKRMYLSIKIRQLIGQRLDAEPLKRKHQKFFIKTILVDIFTNMFHSILTATLCGQHDEKETELQRRYLFKVMKISFDQFMTWIQITSAPKPIISPNSTRWGMFRKFHICDPYFPLDFSLWEAEKKLLYNYYFLNQYHLFLK